MIFQNKTIMLFNIDDLNRFTFTKTKAYQYFYLIDTLY